MHILYTNYIIQMQTMNYFPLSATTPLGDMFHHPTIMGEDIFNQCCRKMTNSSIWNEPVYSYRGKSGKTSSNSGLSEQTLVRIKDLWTLRPLFQAFHLFLHHSTKNALEIQHWCWVIRPNLLQFIPKHWTGVRSELFACQSNSSTLNHF